MKYKMINAVLSAGLLSGVATSSFANHLWVASEAKPSLLVDESKLNAKTKKARQLRLSGDLSHQYIIDNSVEIPLPDGGWATFNLASNNLLPEGLRAKFPNINSYSGVDSRNPMNTGKFELTPKGFFGMFNYQGKTIFIEPKYLSGGREYTSYFREDALPLAGFSESKVLDRRVENQIHEYSRSKRQNSKVPSVNRVYRLAISAAGEYTQFHGGTKESGLAALVTLVNRVNQVYQVDLGISFQLVENNDQIVFTDPESDPFTNSDDDIELNGDVIDEAIGFNNYDIGHIVNTFSGLAQLEAVCTAVKAQGTTGLANPVNDSFSIDYVSHEIGHQFGANHSYNGRAGFCGGGRWPSTAVEPGSGSTIMSYASLCDEQDLSQSADDYFHANSIAQINEFITNGAGANCGVVTNSTNNKPTVSAGLDYVTPVKTPLELNAQAEDSDADVLTYTWEQMNLGNNFGDATDSVSEMVDNGTRPLFRTFKPTTDSRRYLPRMADVLANTTSLGETYATTSRDLNFRVTVRDGQGGVAFDDMIVTTSDVAGPFVVNEPLQGVHWQGEGLHKVAWDVANTNLPPVSCEQVDIWLSTDNGQTFATKLATTNNDGEHSLPTPSLPADQARIKVKCADNIFFNVTTGNFSITPLNKAPVVTTPTNITVGASDANGTSALNDAIVNFLSQAAAVDESEGNVAVTNDAPDVFAIGTTVVTFSAQDSEGNIGTGQASVRVVDMEKPEISLTGANAIVLPIGGTYNEPGFTALDNVDGDISGNVMVSGSVDTSKVGEYTLSYDVVDAAGNIAITQTRLISVQENVTPVITGQVNLTITQGGSLTISLTQINVDDADTDMATLTLTVLDGTNYTVSSNQVTPNANFSGTLTVPVRVSDGNSESEVFNLLINVLEQSSNNGSGDGDSGGSSMFWLLSILAAAFSLRIRKVQNG